MTGRFREHCVRAGCLLIILLLPASFCHARNYQNGLILPDSPSGREDAICCIYTPEEGFSVYGSPGGKLTGKLTRRGNAAVDEQFAYKLFFDHVSDGRVTEIDLSNLKQIGYQIWAISHLERRDGYVRVMGTRFDYWLSEEEIKRKGFKVENWQNFLHSHADDLLGYYANDPGLNLRIAPDPGSKILAVLKGELFEIIPSDQHDGPWTEVRVKKYREHPCRTDMGLDDILEFELTGWIKIVDDNGAPNVWYYSRGC